MPWPMLSSLPVMIAIFLGSNLRRSRRPKLSSKEPCPRPIVRWPTGGPNMRWMPSSALKNWRRPSDVPHINFFELE